MKNICHKLPQNCRVPYCVKGRNSFTVECTDELNYAFPSELQSWGECQCEGDLTTQCPGLTYDIK